MQLSLSGRKQLSYPEGDAPGRRVGGASSALAALGQGFRAWCLALSLRPRSLTPEGKDRVLSGCRHSAPGPDWSRVPYQKAFLPSSMKDATLLSVQAVLKVPFL